MKLISLIACGIVVTKALKWDQLSVPASARGTLNQAEHYWEGALIECDYQCAKQKGYVCGLNQRQCCTHELACVTKYGMQVCEEVDQNFQCQPLTSYPFKL